MENLVSTEVNEKLGLKCQPHPRLYRVSWSQKRHHVINFKIGRLEDNVLCDVIPKDACHLLLGRPWQYDRNMIYDVHVNIVMMWKDGV